MRTAARHSVVRASVGCNRPALRQALLHHLIEYRGVRGDERQVFVLPSAQAAIDLIARVVLTPGDVAWLESPGYGGARAAFEAAGARIQGVTLDQWGLSIASTSTIPKLIFVTPSHQHPTGLLMPVNRRQALLQFAAQTGAAIIEDDYDSEFQFDGRPVAALQGLDAADSVFYVGTFSKSMHKDIRVGYVIVPRGFVEIFEIAQRHTGQIVSATLQDALSEFVAEGHFRAHIRKMTRIYGARRDHLCHALAKASNNLRVVPPSGGMQLIAYLRLSDADEDLTRHLAKGGVTVRPLSRHFVGEVGAQGLFLGFAAWNEREIDDGVAVIAKALRKFSKG